MGNCTSQSESSKKSSQETIQGYIFDNVIGKGGFGKVWRVVKKKTKEIMALKIMSKVKVLSKKSVNSVMNERKILCDLNHPLIVNMHSAFQDRENLYLTMDFICGGDLRQHLISKSQQFTESQALFMAACIVSSLEYIHSKNILHRDIKPENIIFDGNGYLKITDFGISRIWKQDNCQETSGTPGYIAPELLLRQNYGVAIDYYALGVILYEMAMGKRPYKAKDRKELKDQILARQVQIKLDEVPTGWSLEGVDFINRLIQRKPSNRLGNNGPSEVKEHIWLRHFPWQKLLCGDLEAPFVPQKDTNYAAHMARHQQNTDNSEVDRQNALLLRKEEVQSLFAGYEFSASSGAGTKASVSGKQSSGSGHQTPQTSGNTSFTSAHNKPTSSQATSASHSRNPSANNYLLQPFSASPQQSQQLHTQPQTVPKSKESPSSTESSKQLEEDMPIELSSHHNYPKSSQEAHSAQQPK